MNIFIFFRKSKSISSGFYSIFTNSYGKNKIQIDFWILKEHQIGKG